jgi:hypothetical protein
LIKTRIQYLGTSEKKNRPSKKKLFKETYSQVSETQVGRPLDIKPCVSQLFQLFTLDFVWFLFWMMAFYLPFGQLT